MKQFLKFTLASIIGFIIASFLVFILFLGIIAAIATSSKSETKEIANNSLLYLKLDRPIKDRTTNNTSFPTSFNSLTEMKQIGLNDYVKSLERAKTDDNIKGIFLDLSSMKSGFPTLKELREALIDFKESGKFITAYAEDYSQAAYYMATVADEIYLNPEGSLTFQGLTSRTPFYKGLLYKTDIEMQIIRHGKYKGAVEPFILDKMSNENKEQITELIDDIWDEVLESVSSERDISKEDLNSIADDLSARVPKKALDLHLVDDLLYRDQVLDCIKDLLNIDKDKKIKTVTISKYANLPEKKIKKNTDNEIVVIYALGSIASGSGDDSKIKSDDLAKLIRKMRKDDDVKAIVLRINSPGGSALASDVILREIKLAKEKIPIVVSMGDVAASGGYYIACAADKIVAHPTTITGSIGVFGLIPNLQNMYDNKLGITFDGVSSNKNSTFLKSMTKPLSSYERQVITDDIERVYDVFITHVAEGRNMDKAQVDEIGQGRVWTGIDALEIGLVDELGGLGKAIEIAAELAEIEDYKVKELPKMKDPFEKFIENFGKNVTSNILRKELGASYRHIEFIREIDSYSGIQARLPYEIIIE